MDIPRFQLRPASIARLGSLVAAVICILASGPAGAQITTNTPREDFWVPDGLVSATVVTNGTLYIGGDFRYVGPDNGGAIGLDLLTAAPLPKFPRVEGAVYAVASDGQGGRFLGGLFTAVGGVPRRNLAHVLADGSVDPNWHPDAIGLGAYGEKEGIHALVFSDNLVYVGGLFTNVAGATRRNLASLDAVTGAVTAWDPSPDNDVRCLDVVREVGVIVVGGYFTTLAGQFQNYLGAVYTTGTGAGTTWNPNPNNAVLAMVRLGDTLYIAGTFTQIRSDGSSRQGAAAVSVYSGFSTPWDPHPNVPIQALAVTCGNGCASGGACSTIFAAGGFTTIGGLSRNYVAALDPLTGEALPTWNAGITADPSLSPGVSALLAQGDALYIGGRFSTVAGQTRNGIAALNSDTGAVRLWAPNAGGIVNTLQISGGGLFVGGKAVSVGGEARRSLAALDVVTGRLTPWKPNASGIVNALVHSGTNIYIGGTFTNIGGITRSNLAAVSTNGVVVTGWNPNANGSVFALAASPGGIYAGGGFSSISLQSHPGLAFLNPITGAPAATGFNAIYFNGLSQFVGSVYSLVVSNTALFVGGAFNYIGNAGSTVFQPGIAVLSAQFGTNLTSTFAGAYKDFSQIPSQPGTVYSLALSGSTLYVGGQFGYIGGANRSAIAAVSTTTGVAVPSFNPGANSNVYALAVSGANLLAGGQFTAIGGQPRNSAALLDLATGTTQSWDPSASSTVFALASVLNQVYVGGNFLFFGSKHLVGLGVFPVVGAPGVTTQPIGNFLPAGLGATIDLQATGNGTLTYQWRRNGVNVSGTNYAGANGPTLTISASDITTSGDYDCLITNVFGSVLSQPATFTFFQAPAITSPPVDQTVGAGQSLVLNVGATGSPTPGYQWRRNGVNIPGENQSSLIIASAQPTNGGSYDVLVSNPGGSLLSTPAVATITSTSLGFTDLFANSPIYTSFTGLGSGNNANATPNEPGEPKHAGKAGGHSVWIRWQAPATGIANFSTLGSSFDTLLAAYTGGLIDALNTVAFDDDRGGFSCSKIRFAVTQGQVYSIAVDGLGGVTGNIVLSWQLDQSSFAVPRIVTQPFSKSVVPGQNATFTVLADGGGLPVTYYWLQNCAVIFFATESTLTVTNVGPSQAGAYRVLVDNGIYSTMSEPASLELGTDSGAVSADKFEDLISDIIAPMLQSDHNPKRSSYTSVSAGIPGTQVFSTVGASTQVGEPLICGIAGGSSKWFTLRPATNGVLVVDTIGSDIDTLLGAFRGPSIFTLTNVACDNNGAPDGIRSRVVFNVTKNIDYYMAVDGVGGQAGNVAMNWKLGFPSGLAASLTNQYVTRGNYATFVASATGTTPVSYQWRSNGVAIAGATNATLILTNVQPSFAASYSLTVSNIFGVTNSPAASLTVREQMRLTQTNAPAISGGQIQFRVQNVVGMNKLVLEGSTNLINWVPLKTNTPPGATFDLTDPIIGARPYRFYRTKEQ